ncbi:MAG: class I SAM-dependent methyltransferase [Bacteroidota bacterium]|nr:class I SAM-dependent methyltransferase [Bacteroidota bacterium]
MKIVNCPVCNSTPEKLLWSIENADYRRCTTCDLVFESPRLTEEELKEYYSKESYFISNNEKQSIGYIDYFSQCNLGLINEHFEIIKKYSSKQIKIKYLDVGSGPGSLVKLASDNGWEASGLEISKWAVDYAKKNNVNVIEGTLDGVKFIDESFDVISMFDVLEHLSDPYNNIGEIFRILKPGGVLVIETPNTSGFFARFLYKQNSEIVKPRAHICLYSPFTIKFLFSSFKFARVNITTFPYCRKYTAGYVKSLITTRLGKKTPKRQLTLNESMRVIAWK